MWQNKMTWSVEAKDKHKKTSNVNTDDRRIAAAGMTNRDSRSTAAAR
jgi:hypothetical protein